MNNRANENAIFQLRHQVNDLKEQIAISDKRYHQSKVKCRICYFLIVVLLFAVAIKDYDSITYYVLQGYNEVYPSILLFVVMIACWLIAFNEILNYFLKLKYSLQYRRVVAGVTMVLYLIFPLFVIFFMNRTWTRKVEKLRDTFIENSYSSIGVIYKYRSAMKGADYKLVCVGINERYLCEQRIPEDSPLIKSIHIGDTIILRVSDEYPRVNQVLNWHPTPEEIEKYKTPVKLIEKNR